MRRAFRISQNARRFPPTIHCSRNIEWYPIRILSSSWRTMFDEYRARVPFHDPPGPPPIPRVLAGDQRRRRNWITGPGAHEFNATIQRTFGVHVFKEKRRKIEGLGEGRKIESIGGAFTRTVHREARAASIVRNKCHSKRCSRFLREARPLFPWIYTKSIKIWNI